MKTSINNSINKKVLIIIGTFRTGGKERQISELVKGLVAQNYEVYFYSRNITAHYFDKFKDLLAGYKNGKTTNYNKKAVIEMFNYIKEVNPVLIHSWSTETSFLINIYNILKFKKHKIIDGSIRDSFYYKRFSSGWWQRLVCNNLSVKIVSNTKAGILSYKCPAKKSEFVYNGISPERFLNAKLPQTPEIEKKGLIVGMVATYCDKKDYKSFIETGVKIIEKNPEIQFVGIGNKFGNYYEQFKQLIPKEYIDSIILLGEKSNVEEYIQLFDIGVLLTNKEHGAEGISNSIMEYMISGKPVLAYNLGGTPEIIEHKYNGFLVEPDDISECVDKISTLINDNELRVIMGKNAKNTILEKFTFEQMIEKFITIYNNVLN